MNQGPLPASLQRKPTYRTRRKCGHSAAERRCLVAHVLPSDTMLSVKRRKIAITGTILILSFLCAALGRQPLGRSRPDLAAWFFFDDGPLTFSQAYASGSIGPFNIGDTRVATLRQLSKEHLLAQDMPQLAHKPPRWRLSLPSPSGGYSTYTITFTGDRVTAVQAFYSVFAGL